MGIFDFIYYYLTMWFSTSKIADRIRTPQERAAYVLGIVSMIQVLFIVKIIEYLETNSFIEWQIPGLVYIILGLLFIQLYQYIYINRGRYDKFLHGKRPFSSMHFSQRQSINLVLSICILSFAIPMIARIIIFFINGR